MLAWLKSLSRAFKNSRRENEQAHRDAPGLALLLEAARSRSLTRKVWKP
jgi:hypothetical protein